MTRLNAMTVDVEDYFHVSALAEVISRKDWERMEFRAENSTDRLLAMFAEKGIKATFFVLGWVAERFPIWSGRSRAGVTRSRRTATPTAC